MKLRKVVCLLPVFSTEVYVLVYNNADTNTITDSTIMSLNFSGKWRVNMGM